MNILFRQPHGISGLLIFLFFSACTPHTTPNNYTAAGYEEQKMTLEEQEKQNPLSFLSSDGTYRKNLLGRFVLDGTITNKATVATYKDIVLQIKFYSQTETLLGTKDFSIYEYYPPGSTKTFQLKVDAVNGTEKIGWSIIKASNN
ncbi:hypothetical protein BH11BAC7_BH11BAC7_33380 [soil metagenome]